MHVGRSASGFKQLGHAQHENDCFCLRQQDKIVASFRKLLKMPVLGGHVKASITISATSIIQKLSRD